MNTIKINYDGIVNYFENRSTNTARLQGVVGICAGIKMDQCQKLGRNLSEKEQRALIQTIEASIKFFEKYFRLYD